MNSLMDKTKKAEILQRIREGKAPLFMEKKPNPESPSHAAQETSTYANNDLGKEIQILREPLWNPKAYVATHHYARVLLAEKNLRLPSNVLHDDYLVYTNKWETLHGKCSSAMSLKVTWAREILAYPEINGVFKKGEDIRDAATGWTIKAKDVPKEAMGVKGAGLFIDPENIDGWRVIPRTIIVLTGMIQELHGVGRVDEVTRIPLAVPKQVLDSLKKNEKRIISRRSETSVRPICRGAIRDCLVSYVDISRDVYCNIEPTNKVFVTGVRF